MTSSSKLKKARSITTSPETLAKLAHDSDDDIRFYVAIHPNTPLEILYKLSDEYFYPISLNSRIPEDLFLKCRAKILKHKLTEWPD